MKTKHYECDNCEAVYQLKHDLDADHYQPVHCAFCGEVLDDDSNFEVFDETLDLN
jgi:hypothetical protein